MIDTRQMDPTGVLCTGCNSAIGLTGDSSDCLRRLASYLDRANERRGAEHSVTTEDPPFDQISYMEGC